MSSGSAPPRQRSSRSPPPLRWLCLVQVGLSSRVWDMVGEFVASGGSCRSTRPARPILSSHVKAPREALVVNLAEWPGSRVLATTNRNQRIQLPCSASQSFEHCFFDRKCHVLSVVGLDQSELQKRQEVAEKPDSPETITDWLDTWMHFMPEKNT